MGISFSTFFSRLFPKHEARIVMVGLDAAGKTTILYKLKLGEVVSTIPSIGFNVESVEHKNVSLTIWDIGGQDRIRALWRHYFKGCQAIKFVADSNDPDRFAAAGEELQKMLNHEKLADSALLVFANKQDLPNAKSAAVLSDKLGLNALRSREWHIQSCAATTGDGLFEGLDWLTTALAKRQ